MGDTRMGDGGGPQRVGPCMEPVERVSCVGIFRIVSDPTKSVASPRSQLHSPSQLQSVAGRGREIGTHELLPGKDSALLQSTPLHTQQDHMRRGSLSVGRARSRCLT